MDLTHELNVAYDLAKQAAVIILKVYGTNFSVKYKGRNDPVTEADQRANQLIVEGLHQSFPADVIVAEESPPPLPTAQGVPRLVCRPFGWNERVHQ